MGRARQPGGSAPARVRYLSGRSRRSSSTASRVLARAGFRFRVEGAFAARAARSGIPALSIGRASGGPENDPAERGSRARRGPVPARVAAGGPVRLASRANEGSPRQRRDARPGTRAAPRPLQAPGWHRSNSAASVVLAGPSRSFASNRRRSGHCSSLLEVERWLCFDRRAVC